MWSLVRQSSGHRSPRNNGRVMPPFGYHCPLSPSSYHCWNSGLKIVLIHNLCSLHLTGWRSHTSWNLIGHWFDCWSCSSSSLNLIGWNSRNACSWLDRVGLLYHSGWRWWGRLGNWRELLRRSWVVGRIVTTNRLWKRKPFRKEVKSFYIEIIQDTAVHILITSTYMYYWFIIYRIWLEIINDLYFVIICYN